MGKIVNAMFEEKKHGPIDKPYHKERQWAT